MRVFDFVVYTGKWGGAGLQQKCMSSTEVVKKLRKVEAIATNVTKNLFCFQRRSKTANFGAA